MEETYLAINNLEKMKAAIVDGETGVRGFALTRNTDFLSPYINSRRITDSLFKSLLISARNNNEQQRRMQEIKPLIKKRFDIFTKTIDYYNNIYPDTSFNLTQMQLQSKNVMNSIRLTVDIMQNEEKKLLEKRNVHLKGTFGSVYAITLISLLLTILLVVIGFVTYTKESKKRRKGMQQIDEYQQQLTNRIEQLDAANIQLMQMRSMEKFTATGRIARTIAHEVRNPLTNIDLAGSQLKDNLENKDDETLYLFDIIERNSKRINKLIAELLQSTKFSELNFLQVPVTQLLNETLVLAKDRMELNKIKLQTDYKSTVKINVDAHKMQIAFLNIIVNAVEAMEPGRGLLMISTFQEADECVIVIKDNGKGMDENSLHKIFEPYFTSKQNGNGLGLANTQNIIFNHKGTITADSSPGQGASFTIRLQ